MSMVPPNAYITPASPVVVEQISRLNDKADHLDALALSGIENMLGLNFANVDLDPRWTITDEDLDSLLNQLGELPEFDPNTDWLAGLSLGFDDASFVFNPEIYQYLRQQLPEYSIPALGAKPTAPSAPPEPGEPEEIAPPDRPTLPQYTAPDVEVDAELPVYEDFTAEIPFPILRPINLPTVPTINTDDIVFDGVRPVFDAAPPNADDFIFVNETYQPLVMTETKAMVLSIFNGGSGLPQAIEDAIFERAREREVELGEREVELATDDWAARGWKHPPGMLEKARQRARQNASNKVSQLNREQVIEQYKAQLDMLKSAMQTALGLEEVWMRQFTAAEDRRLQALKMKLDLSLQVFNAYVTQFQALSSLYAIDAQVFNQKFQAAMAKLQLYSEQLRSAQLIGELNEQDVRIFAQRVGALEANAQIYTAKVNGYRALFEAVQSKVDVFKAQLESNQILLSGYETDTRAFTARLQAQTARDDRFKTRADIFATNMKAYSDQIDILFREQDRSFKLADLRRDDFNSNTQRISAFISGESSRINAVRDKYAALASSIQSKSEVERSRYELYLKAAQAKIAQYEAAANILLKNGEINIQSMLTAEGLMLRAHETATTTLAQLAAGYTSAANVNASISDSSGSSISYNFSGELEVN